MKRITSLLLMLCVLTMLCTSTLAESNEQPRILIAYFTRLDNTTATLDEIIAGGGPYGGIGSSWEDRDVDAIASASLTVMDDRVLGNTQAIAEMIQAEVGGDLFSIQGVESYPVNYDALIDQGGEEGGREARPELKTAVEDMAQYDIVFLGYPSWWYDMPMAVCTFLESYDFSGKTVIPFVTSASSGMARSESRLRDMLPTSTLSDNALEIVMYDVANSQPEVHRWLAALGMVTE